PADHDAGARGVHVDPQPVTGALDFDPADGRAFELAPQVVADLPVFDERVGVFLLVGDPARLPVGGDAQAEPVGIDLLAHYSPSSSSCASSASGASSVPASTSVSGSASASTVSVSAASTSVLATASVSSTSAWSCSSSCSWS